MGPGSASIILILLFLMSIPIMQFPSTERLAYKDFEKPYYFTESVHNNLWIHKLWNSMQEAVTRNECTGCHGLVGTLRNLAELGDGTLIDIIRATCYASGKIDPEVCTAAVEREGPVFADALRNMTIGGPLVQGFCYNLLGMCKKPDIMPWKMPLPSSKSNRTRPRPSGKKPIKIVQYSDIHVDREYTVGRNADCNQPLCCRPSITDDNPGGGTWRSARPFGEHRCGTPETLEESMYKAIRQVVPDAAFALFTGDIVDQASWNSSAERNREQILKGYGIMHNHMDLVYGTIGNHEASPVNHFPSNQRGNKNEAQWLYDTMTEPLSDWVGNSSAQTMEEFGGYSRKYPHGNLRIISLNTNFYFVSNFWRYKDPPEVDPSGQLHWLMTELDAAEKAGENVYIIGHIPPGDVDTMMDSSSYVNQILNRYSSTIAAMFFGHTHTDHFEITYPNSNAPSRETAKIVSYICPSLTPTDGMPAFRVYDVDPDTFGILDSTTYVANMTDKKFQTDPVWELSYSAKGAYGSQIDPPVTEPEAELTPAFWHDVTELFRDDEDIFNDYMSRKTRGWKPMECLSSCKTREIRRLRTTHSGMSGFEAQPGTLMSRRDFEPLYEGHSDCGASVIVATLSAMMKNEDLLVFLVRRIRDEMTSMKV